MIKYTEDHEWLQIDGDTAVVGITHHAQDALGDVVFVDLPEVGKSFTAKEAQTMSLYNYCLATGNLYEQAIHAIKSSATRGELAVFIRPALSHGNCEKLNKLGYKVSQWPEGSFVYWFEK
jgi:hypothetical protein